MKRVFFLPGMFAAICANAQSDSTNAIIGAFEFRIEDDLLKKEVRKIKDMKP